MVQTWGHCSHLLIWVTQVAIPIVSLESSLT